MNKDLKRKDNKGRVLRTGEGQKSNGRYFFKYKDNTGKYRFEYSNRLLKSDRTPVGCIQDLSLREKEEIIMRNLRDGIIGGGDITLLELAENYIATKTLSSRESTQIGYRTVLNYLRKDPFSQNQIDCIKKSDVKRWFIALQTKHGKGYSTIHNIRGVLNPAFKMAVEDDLIRKNPFDFPLSDAVKNDSKVRKAITPAQEKALLEFIKEDKHYSKYYEGYFILLNTGLRISEFCGLTVKDIDFEKGYIHVGGQLVRYSDMVYRYEPTKTAAGTRKVPMSPEVAQCFQTIIDNGDYLKSEMVVDGKSGFLFLDQHKKPVVALHWEHRLKRIVTKYNETYKEQLPVITPHVLRHTFCSKMARKGMNPKNLQYIMGHSEIAVTMNTYTHLTFDDAQEDFMKIWGN